jgi:two-component system, chemotaxis family, chemotaxis protein CheY
VPDQRRVLIVEDDPSIANLLNAALSDEGYEVRHAPDGAAGLDLLEQWLPDVILLDLMLPIMNGWEFRAAQQKLPAPAGAVPVVVVTAARDAVARSDELRARAIVLKPFDLDQMLDLVATVVAPAV